MEERCGLDLPVVLQEETDIYMKHVVLPPSIAMTRALKENVFAVIVGIETRLQGMGNATRSDNHSDAKTRSL